ERRKEGKKERRKEGKKERRKEGKKERRKEGKKERRKEGATDWTASGKAHRPHDRRRYKRASSESSNERSRHRLTGRYTRALGCQTAALGLICPKWRSPAEHRIRAGIF